MTARPFLSRLLLPFTLLIVLVVALCGLVVYLAGERAAYDRQMQALNRVAELAGEWLATAGVAGGPVGQGLAPEAARKAADVARVLGTRVTLIDGGGIVRFDSEANVARLENHNDRPEVRAARRDGSGTAKRHSVSVDADSVYLARRVAPDDPQGWVIRLAYAHAPWTDAAGSVWVIVAASVAAALLLVAVLARLLMRQWIEPTRALADAVERMAGGEWQLRVPPAGADELQSFSIKLSALAQQVQRQLAELRTQRGDLQVLVDTLPDSIITTDAAGRIALINRPASRLLDLSPEQARGTKLVAAVNDHAVLELFDAGGRDEATNGFAGGGAYGAGGGHAPSSSVASPYGPGYPGASSDGDMFGGGNAGGVATTNVELVAQPVQRVVRLTRNGARLTFQAFATPTAGGGVLLVLRDVSQMAATVQMKTDFVANASHELRTPIAAIKIAFETLREIYTEDPDQADRCMVIISGHLGRLEEMLRDLLDLSRVETPDLKPQLRLTRTSDVFTLVRSALGPLAREKGIELRLADDPAGADVFYTDERLLNLALKNLVENSIKFTPAGGSVTIDVSPGDGGAGESDGDVRISVTDTGIGIPPEHVDRVFERFYQVDPARSGSAGRGTGLGLAIVKHAIAGLGGTINLRSKVGAGTTVTCVLPQTSPREQDEVGELM